MRKEAPNIIHAEEAYSKQELLKRLSISQKTWDQMLRDGLPYAQVGKAKWVVGQNVLDYLKKKSITKDSSEPS